MGKVRAFTILLVIMLTLPACSETPALTASATPTRELASPTPHSTGQIYLYGIASGEKIELDKLFEIWSNYYQNDNLRHLFFESSYYLAEYLNEWMLSGSDEILEELYNNIGYSSDMQEFYKRIKSECPKTIFHGTDIGSYYTTLGAKYIKHLDDLRLEGSETYKLALENIEQGKVFFASKNYDWAYRENKLSENFIREFDKLSNDSIMGIYVEAHTRLNAKDYSQTVPSMASQLKNVYGEVIHSEDISWMVRDIKPLRYDIITVKGKDYEASYYGSLDITGYEGFVSREFWRLENAYDDFKYCLKSGTYIPYNNYPMLIEKGQVFVVDYTSTDGSVMRTYLISDGSTYNGQGSTKEIKVD